MESRQLVYAEKQIRDFLLGELIEDHPKVSREFFEIRQNNVEFVRGRVSRVLDDLFKDQAVTLSEDDEKFKILCIDEDDRYTQCQQSVNSTHRICLHLESSKLKTFTFRETEEVLSYLTMLLKHCRESAADVQEVKEKMKNQMTQWGAEQGLEKQLLLYTNALTDQLKSVYRAFEKEYEVGNLFLTYLKSLITSHYSAVKPHLNSKGTQAIAQAYTVLVKNQELDFPEVNSLNKELLGNLVDQYADFLEDKRIQFEFLKKIVILFEDFSEKLHETPKSSSLSTSSSEKTKTDQKASRMSMMSKFVNKYFR